MSQRRGQYRRLSSLSNAFTFNGVVARCHLNSIKVLTRLLSAVIGVLRMDAARITKL
jgi:hypothetical protein